MQRIGGYVSRENQTVGCFATCSLFFGIFLMFPGAALTGIGNSGDRDDDFFEESHRPMRIIGPILLVLGICLVITGILLCMYLRKSSSSQQALGTTLQTNQTSQPVVAGTAPQYQPAVVTGPPQQHPYPGSGYQSGYPPPQGQGYPPPQGQGYPPPQGQGYPPPQGQGYPPPQGQGYPPPQGQGYPPPQPSAPFAPAGDGQGGAAPPPSYDSVANNENLQKKQ